MITSRFARGAAALIAAATIALIAAASPAVAGSGSVNAIEGKQFSGELMGGCITTAPVEIAWGDGATSTAGVGSDGVVTGAHTYPEEGAYDATVTGCSAGPLSVAVTVGDAPLTLAPSTIDATAGQSLTANLATFSDADPGGVASDYTATVAWGDGSHTAATITAVAGGYQVTASHSYAITGSSRPTVTVVDAGGAQASGDATVNVTAVPQAIAAFATQGLVRAGGLGLFDASTSRSGGADVSSYTWIIHGPGVIGGTATATCGTGTSQLETSFVRSGPETVTLRVTDASGAVTATTHVVTVTGDVRLRRGPHVTQALACLRGPTDAAINATLNGGPPQGCQDYVLYDLGLIQAVGCFQALTSVSQIPNAEYNVLCPHLQHTSCKALIGGAQPPELLGAATSPKAASLVATDAKATGGPFTPFFISTSEVRINGLDVTPAPGAAILLDFEDGYLISSNATVSVLNGALVIHRGKLDTPSYNQNGDIPLLDANLDGLQVGDPKLQQLLDLGGFKLSGWLSVDVVKHGESDITAGLTLPGSLTDISGHTLTSQLIATADNKDGLVLDHLFSSVPAAKLGGFELDNLSFCYQAHISEGFCQQQTGASFDAWNGNSSSWNATAKISLLGVTVNADPPPPRYGLGFVDGNFAFGGGSVSFPDPGIPIGDTGVDLKMIGASFGLDPVNLTGQIGLNLADTVTLDNATLFMVFASQNQPYTFTGSELGPKLNLPQQTAQGFALAAGGSIGVKVPVINKTLDLLNGWVEYIYPGYFAAFGGIHFDPFNGLLVIDGSIEGQFDAGNAEFDLEGKESIKTPLFSAGADAVLSSTGIGACGSVSVFGHDVGAGAGYKWGDSSPSFWLGSCDLSPYQTTISAAHDASAGTILPVRSGLPVEMVKLVGLGGAPDVTITGPDGSHASTDGGRQTMAKPFAIYRIPQENATYIAILDPPGGGYMITANPGSPAIVQVLHAEGINPMFKAHVTTRGGHYAVLYSVRPEPGQRVTFAERSGRVYHVIGSTTAGNGTIRFTPAAGPGGPRELVAEITENGVPIVLSPNAPAGRSAQRILARYIAPGPRVLARVTGIRVRHVGTAVLVSFGGVAGAHRYAVAATLSNGQHALIFTARPRLTISGVPGEFGGRIAIQALGNGATTRSGPTVIATVRRERF